MAPSVSVQLEESVRALAAAKDRVADEGPEAFEAFRKAVTQASRGREAPPAKLLGPLECKEEVINFLVALHASKKMYRRQIVAVMSVLMHERPWLETLLQIEGLKERLPEDLRTIVEDELKNPPEVEAEEPEEPEEPEARLRDESPSAWMRLAGGSSAGQAPLFTAGEPGRDAAGRFRRPARSMTWEVSMQASLSLLRAMSTPLLDDGMVYRTSSWKEKLVDEMIKVRDLPEPEDGELERRLNATELTLLGIGACIGAGVFVLTGAEARIAGPSVAVSFLLAGISSIFNGLCFAELATRLPVSGSAYLYVYCMFGELPALMLVVNQLVDYHIGAATLARSLVAYVAEAMSQVGFPFHECISGCQPFESMPWVDLSLGAPLVLAFVAMVVSRGAETNAVVTSFVTLVKIAVVIVVILVGYQRMQVQYLQPFFPYGVSATIQSAATLSYAFIGYDVIANAAEECQDPARDLPRAMIYALMTCAVLYVCVCLVLCGMQTFATIDTSAPVSTSFQLQGMEWVVSIVDVGSFAGMLTGLLAGVYGQSRIYFAMSRDGLAPAMLQGASTCAWWCGLVAALLAAFFDVKSLAAFLNIGVLLSYAMTAASVLLINTCCKTRERPMMFLAACLSGVLSMGGLTGMLGGAGLLALFVFAYCTCNYKCGPPSTFKCPGTPIIPLIALCANVYLMCHLKSLAWIRLLVVSLLVFMVHSSAVCLGVLDPKKDRRLERSVQQLAVARAGLQRLGFSAVDTDGAIDAFAVLNRAVLWIIQSPEKEDDEVLARMDDKEKVLEFLADFHDRKPKHRSRVTALCVRLMEFDSWREALDSASPSISATLHAMTGLAAAPPASVAVNVETAAELAASRGCVGAIYIRVIRGKGLASGNANPFVRVAVGSKVQRTESCEDEVSPCWDAAPFVFEVPKEDAEVTLDVISGDITGDRHVGSAKFLLSDVQAAAAPRMVSTPLSGGGGLEYEVLFRPALAKAESAGYNDKRGTGSVLAGLTAAVWDMDAAEVQDASSWIVSGAGKASSRVPSQRGLICPAGHAIDKRKEGMSWRQSFIHGDTKLCDVCRREIARAETRWRCFHHCDFNVCQGCYEAKKDAT
ncbi:unnamed protein product [Effrenium voratum]|uniref:C2 domain-containing protein n=1 Tax=Effrenium voratum TaxID=2562239 RepID=A0AA36MK80_9DINO|nr:unnamed protein product [Effrenium voratum]